jgi:hypothetical protein
MTEHPVVWPTPITVTLHLGHCWACRKRFVKDGGDDPSLIRNEHHVVPRCYGGEDGPTVTLCSADHDLLHALATRMIAGDEWKGHQLIRGLDGIRAGRIAYMASVVLTADRATAGDPNKRFVLTLELAPAYRKKMEKLKSVMSARSYGELAAHLIDAEYAKRFPLTAP